MWKMTNGDGTIFDLTGASCEHEADAEARLHDIADARRERPWRWWLVIAPDKPLRYHHCWRIRWSDEDATHVIDFHDWTKAMRLYIVTYFDHPDAKLVRVVGSKPIRR